MSEFTAALTSACECSVESFYRFVREWTTRMDWQSDAGLRQEAQSVGGWRRLFSHIREKCPSLENSSSSSSLPPEASAERENRQEQDLYESLAERRKSYISLEHDMSALISGPRSKFDTPINAASYLTFSPTAVHLPVFLAESYRSKDQ